MTTKNLGKLFLNKEISIKDLEEGVEFEVDCEENFSDSEDESCYSEDAFKTFKGDLEELSVDLKPKLLSHKNIPFPVLRERMETITSDGKVLKEILKPGFCKVVPELSVVLVHYDVFLENQLEPFDSTRLRKKPYKFLLGDVGVLPGLELGIKTMKINELSRFLVGPEYAYGVLGCPPRIPPYADVLFEVELITFYSKAAIEFDDMARVDQKKASFEEVASVYHAENNTANDLFRSKCYKKAISRYRKVANMLQELSVKNEEEDDKRNSYLLKLYLNLAQSYIHVQNPQKAIIYASMALRIDENNTKGLFRKGYALLQAGDYGRSEHYLTRVNKIIPYDKSVKAALSSLESKRKQHVGWEKMFCQKAFFKPIVSETVKDLCETDDFVIAVDEQIKDFLNSGEEEFIFSPSYSESQLDVVLKLAKKYNLAFFSKVMNDIKINKVVKTNKTVNFNNW